MNVDDDLKDILVEIPSQDIALGHDADGLPKTVAADAVEAEDEAPKPPALDPEKLRKDLEEQRREADTLRQARMREQREAEAALAAEREARTAAETKLTETTGVAWNAHEARLRAEYQHLEGAVKSTQRLMETTKRELRAAKEAGDMDREIAAQEALAEAHADLRALEFGRSKAEDELRGVQQTLEARAKAIPEPKKVEAKAEPKTEVATPEQWIAQFPRKTQAWLSANKDYVTDPAKHQALQAFAGEWVADYGQATLHTPAFIEALNEKFVPKEIEVAEDRDEPEVVAEKVAAPAGKPKAKTASAAPVSRNASLFSSRNMDASQVRLPPKLAAFVRQSGLDPTAYALGAVADIKAGKLPKNFLDPDYPHDF